MSSAELLATNGQFRPDDEEKMIELQMVDPIAWVLARPAQFFRTARVEALLLLTYVLADVVVLGGGECRISSEQFWWFVSSNADWMDHEKFSGQELFSQVVSDPRLGEHSLRSEILLHAFASDVFLGGPEGHQSIKGQSPAQEFLDRHIDWSWTKRLVAVRVDETA